MAPIIVVVIFLAFLTLIILADLCFACLLIVIHLFDLQARKMGPLYVPSKSSLVGEMVSICGSVKGKTVVDLGSGDGRLLIAFAKAGANKCTGYEINSALVWYSRLRVRFAGLSQKVEIREASYWNIRLKHVDIATIFGVPNMMGRLEKKLRNELRPGALVVSNELVFPTWKLFKRDGKIFLYRVS